MYNKIILISALILIITGISSCKVVKHSDMKKSGSDENVSFYFENDDFDAAAYVEENWDERILPEIKENAIPLTQLLEEIKNNFDKAASVYGVQKEDTSPFSFAIKAETIIENIDKESAAGILSVEIPDLTNEGYCEIQIGPVIKKSMVRDYLSFIKFGDFENQIEFANVSRELNFYIRDNIVNVIDESFVKGESISFFGVYTYDKSGAVLITPVEIKFAGGSE